MPEVVVPMPRVPRAPWFRENHVVRARGETDQKHQSHGGQSNRKSLRQRHSGVIGGEGTQRGKPKRGGEYTFDRLTFDWAAFIRQEKQSGGEGGDHEASAKVQG